MTTREEQIAGIRQLADWLEANPAVPVPYHLDGRGSVLIMTHTLGDPKVALAAVTRALPGPVTKTSYGEGEEAQFKVAGHVGTIKVEAIADREAVCKRVVTGIREVTKTVPDPTAPLVEVTETVEDVEWVCGPVLAAAQTAYSDRLTELEPDGIPAKAEVSA